jgi:hypothetical protein
MSDTYILNVNFTIFDDIGTGQIYEYLAISLRSKNPKHLAHHISRFTSEKFELELLMEKSDNSAGFNWGTSSDTFEYTNAGNTGKMTFQKVAKVCDSKKCLIIIPNFIITSYNNY